MWRDVPCASAAPNNWRIEGCAGCCGGRLTVFAVHTPLSTHRGGGPAPPPPLVWRRVVRTSTHQHNKTLGSGTLGAFRLRSDKRLDQFSDLQRTQCQTDTMSPPPPSGGAECLEAPKALIVGLNRLEPKAPDKFLIGRRPGRKIGPIFEGAGGAAPPPPPLGTLG